jgi:flagellar biosynthetic protein FliR
VDYFVQNFQAFLLVMMRLFGMFVVAPFFSSGTIPFRIRAATAAYVTVAVFPLVANTIGPIPESLYLYALLALSEVFIGILIGFFVSVIFASFQLAARVFSFQMALGIAEVVDPFSQVGITLVGQLWTLMGLMIFIAIDGPHQLVMVTTRSFSSVRVFDLAGDGALMFRHLVSAFGAMFLVALKLAFPILATLFLLTFTLGMLAKAAPQMNVFMVGIPIQIGVGFLVMLVIIGAIALGMSAALGRAMRDLMVFVRALGG